MGIYGFLNPWTRLGRARTILECRAGNGPDPLRRRVHDARFPVPSLWQQHDCQHNGALSLTHRRPCCDNTNMTHTNRLIHETSPYLRQHAHNPVDWYPWGEEALTLAKERDLPIFLSIGYSACHWCHVMERESFEDGATASVMNAGFINVKVDREERPDLDSIYMEAVQLMTRHGGWPMSVFLLPDGTPFHGGTYFPPIPHQGMPSFRQVLQAVSDAYTNRRDELTEHGRKLVSMLQSSQQRTTDEADLPAAILAKAVRNLRGSFDSQSGGFGGAPKFPQPMNLDFLLAHSWEQQNMADRHMAEHTLTKMLNGGIYDQLGGGFHRYSVDAVWLVPHFEKMLYDNAQLLRTCLSAWQLSGHNDYLRVINETFAWLQGEMTHADGGFYSAQDADSEGEEGKFFVWSLAEIEEVLPEDEAAAVTVAFGVSEEGNFEGHNILNRPLTPDEVCRRLRLSPRRLQVLMDKATQTLFEVRAQRIHPATDDKILCEWNGLTIHALAECGAVLADPDMLAAARKAAHFVWDHMRDADGSLLRTWKDGTAPLRGYLEDHAAYGRALLALFEAEGDSVWLQRCQAIAAIMLAEFEDQGEEGGFFQTSHNHESLVIRRKDYQDNAIPSGNSMAAEFLVRLAWTTDESRYLAAAQRVFQGAGAILTAYPTAASRMVSALQSWQATPQEVVITGDPSDPVKADLARQARRMYHPYRIVVEVGPKTNTDLPMLAGKSFDDGRPAAWVCRNKTCLPPVHTVQDLLAIL